MTRSRVTAGLLGALLALIALVAAACGGGGSAGAGGATPGPAATSGPASAAPTRSANPAAPLVAGSPTSRVGNPFASAALYVDPASDAAQSAGTLRASNPAAARALARIAATPEFYWVAGIPTTDVRADVAGRVAIMRAAGALPLLVAYDLPDRDCGGYSAGGATTPDAYRQWIRAFTAGIGSGPAVVVLEPDALANADCLPAGERTTRYQLLADAVGVLADRGVSVYLDGGNSRWKPASTMASRLKAAGVTRARGFALNVSNFNPTGNEVAYGEQIDAALGRSAHFLVDTSRNGLGPEPGHDWCNPPGRALGTAPTVATGDAKADAFLWVKRPGESDGTCHGGPAAGQWWPSYAVGLAERAPH